MVLAHLLTYRLDIPQEGRLTIDVPRAADCPRSDFSRAERDADAPITLDLRLAVMPTAHGLRAAVRLPAELTQPRTLEDLSLPPQVAEGLRRFAASDQGMLIVTGPAGSGKTTTIYALLRHIADTSPGLSIITLEDPVERHLPGVTQIEVKPFGELTYERALRSILRQDPQVLMLGEIRDAATASLALQAALSGHRLVCTLHAGTPGGAVARLVEMGMEPYQITSSLLGVVAQRLLRRRNPSGAGYLGRTPVAEFAPLEEESRQAVLRRADAGTLDRLFSEQPGHVTLRQSAATLVVKGVTNAEEVARVLGTAP
jgi:general secretion pathway protein E